MNTSCVKIIENERGGIFSLPIEGSVDIIINLEQVENYCDQSGYLTRIPRKAAILSRIEDALYMEYVAGDKLSGKIVIKESIEPVIPQDPEFLLKWEEGRVCRHQGKPIYRKQFYWPDTSIEDTYIPND